MPTSNDLFSDAVKNSSTCVFCKKQHDIKDYYRSQRMTFMERKDAMKK
jgi:hypothetical protein